VLAEVRQILTEGSLGWTLSGRAHWGEYLPGWHPWEDYALRTLREWILAAA
jgi:hypothetical protein